MNLSLLNFNIERKLMKCLRANLRTLKAFKNLNLLKRFQIKTVHALYYDWYPGLTQRLISNKYYIVAQGSICLNPLDTPFQLGPLVSFCYQGRNKQQDIKRSYEIHGILRSHKIFSPKPPLQRDLSFIKKPQLIGGLLL